MCCFQVFTGNNPTNSESNKRPEAEMRKNGTGRGHHLTLVFIGSES